MQMATAKAGMADEAFTHMLLADQSKRSQQLRISGNEVRLASHERRFIGSHAEIIHIALAPWVMNRSKGVIGKVKVKNSVDVKKKIIESVCIIQPPV